MKKVCICGKEIDERLNYCVHCGKEIVRKTEEKKCGCSCKKKSPKYSPMLEITNS